MSNILLNGNYELREYAGVIEIAEIGQSWVPLPDFPISLTVNGDTNITFISTTGYYNPFQYYIININSGSLLIDGGNLTHIISTTNYPGLFQNGGPSFEGFSNVSIKNFNLNCVGVMNVYAGWLCQQYFANSASNNIITNCNSNGDINEYGGGIVGGYFGYNGSDNSITDCWSSGAITYWSGGITGIGTVNCTINNCYSTGNIEHFSGGIVANESSYVTISNCYSSTLINQTCGGIIGNNCNNMIINNYYTIGNVGIGSGGIIGSGCNIVEINNCYSVGNILSNGGGIIASGNNSININNCYSLGNIDSGCGGITGTNNGTTHYVNINNCYSIGTINVNSGGITGLITGSNTIITNCYVVGNIISGGNPFVGSSSSSIIITNSFSEANGIWNDLHASTYLTTLNIWISVSPNTPYLLQSFNAPSYTTTNLIMYSNSTSNLILNSTDYPNFELVNNITGVTINSTTGQITVTSAAQSQTVSLIIYNYENTRYGYNISYLYLVINSYSNNIQFNELIQKINNMYLLTSDFSNNVDLIIYLPKSYIFNGQKYQINVNTISFIVNQQNTFPVNSTTLVTNTNIISKEGSIISDISNFLFSNCQIFFKNRNFYNHIVGQNCTNISIFNCNFNGSGTIVAEKCKYINIISSQFEIKVNKKYTGSITDKDCKNIIVKNCYFKIKVTEQKCSSLIGYNNSNIKFKDNTFISKIKAHHCKYYICGKSRKIKIYKCNGKIIKDGETTKLYKDQILNF